MKNLVLFWGWTRNEVSYKSLIDAAPKDWKIYQISFADIAPGGNRNNFQQNILDFFKKNNLSKACVMGQSLGGAFAIEFACHNPDKVEHLYLVDSEGIYGEESLAKMTKNLLLSTSMYASKKAFENFKAVYRLLRNPIQNGRLAHYGHHANLEQEAKMLKVSTTILWGEKDNLTPIWQGQKLHSLIKNSKLVLLKDMDHDWILHRPELFWESIS